jgi:hypothetical protein
MVINIKITDKRPSVEGAPVIVCGNSDYTIKFTFDAEWDAYSTKTVRFVWVEKGRVRFKDVEMTGTTCAVPVMHSTNRVRVGVYAGDLRTTTPAVIPCEWSILCEGGIPATEDYEYYANEAKDAANEAKDAANEAKDAANEAKDAASSAAASANVARGYAFDVSMAVANAQAYAEEAATERGRAVEAKNFADASAERAVLAADRAEVAASRAEKAVEEKGGALFSNALKGKKSGGIVSMSDISPLEHTLGVRVRSKNLIPYPYVSTSGTRNGVTFTDNGDGSITVKGTATTTVSFNFSNGNIFEVGKTYLLGVGVIVAYKDASGTSRWTGGAGANVTSLTWENGYTLVMIYYQVSANKSVDETIYPFVVESTDTPEYTPYVPDISAVKVKKYADEPDAAIEYPVNADGTVDGVTSIYPTTTLVIDTAGAVIDVEYNRDINKAFAELYNAIISLGGNV